LIVIGRIVSHYQILEKLGAGGMGVVYRARDSKLDRDVVLKFLSPTLTADDEATRRLVQEAKAASALDHPNICTIYGLDQSDDGQVFISMAYYRGQVLKNRLEAGPLPVEAAVEITRQIAGGLAAAHERGIIHRDIKPGNIIVTGEGVAKLLDFGGAKLAGASRITQAGMAIGTAAYMSPEQLRGLEVDRRTDIWSLGVLLYEMVTGELPFRGDRLESVIRSILEDKPAPIAGIRSGVPEKLEQIIDRALVKDRTSRYSDMSELLRDLKLLAADSSSETPAIAERALSPRPTQRPIRLVAAALTVLVLAGGALVWKRTRSSSAKAPPAARSDSAIPGAAPAALKRLAVLPLTNLSKDTTTDYLSYALADRITDRLGYFKGVVVRPSSATREYQNQRVDVASVGKKLRADYILAGDFSSVGQTVRLNFELVSVDSGRRIAQEPVEVGHAEMFRLQDLVAEKVVRGLELPEGEGDRTKADVPRNPLAYQQYLQSLSYPHGYGGNELAFPLLKKSIELDPGYAPAYAELGSRRELAAVYALGGAAEVTEAEQAFTKALSLNGQLLDALSGLARLYTDIGQSDKAIGLLRDALKINPNHADSHFALSYIYRYAGMLKESAQEGELALSLDPNNPRYRSLATTYLYLGDFDRSLETHKLDPDSGWTLARVGQIYLRRGQKERALESFKRAIQKEPESSSGRWAAAMRAAVEGRVEEGLAALGRSKEAGMVDGEQRYHFANVHCLLGDRDGCVAGLQAAVDGGFFNYPFLLKDSFLEPIRTDHRFQRILARAKEKHEAFQARFFPSEPVQQRQSAAAGRS
jgi:serine/threonine protein kinase/tetratricopeptide (TPR) repeat protein